jgi:hypothetical protein
VLPDAASGQGPGSLAAKLSRRAPRERSEQRGCKEGMARVFAVLVQILLSIMRVAPKALTEAQQASGVQIF